MTKQKIRILVPLVAVAGLLLYCWSLILLQQVGANRRHYVGLLLFIPLPFLFLKHTEACTLALGTFLLLATFNLLAITPTSFTFWLKIGPIPTPSVQPLSLLILILYGVLNMYPLFDIYLDYKERKEASLKK